VPVENSTEGAVTSTLDLLVESSLRITAEVRLDVEQCLLGTAPSGRRSGACCRIPQGSRSAGAGSRRISRRRASSGRQHEPRRRARQRRSRRRRRREPHGGRARRLAVLAADIQDETGNATRFFVLGIRTPRARPATTRRRSSAR
jgi:chorismate mutase/prephenate dehydratase